MIDASNDLKLASALECNFPQACRRAHRLASHPVSWVPSALQQEQSEEDRAEPARMACRNLMLRVRSSYVFACIETCRQSPPSNSTSLRYGR